MEPMLSMRTAAVLLALAALGGLVMAGMRWAGKPHPPTWLAMVRKAALPLVRSAVLSDRPLPRTSDSA